MNKFSQLDKSKLKKINVIGSAASGKTTVSKKISEILKTEFIEIDEIFWEPNWKKPTNKDFYDRLKKRLDENQTGFVLDGNYTKATALKWQHSETVIWINLPFLQTLWQLSLRSLKRLITNKELWANTGNKESIYGLLFTKDSVFYWLFKTFKGNQVKFKYEMQSTKWQHLQFIELTSNSEIEAFLNYLITDCQ